MNRFFAILMALVMATAPTVAQIKDVTPGTYTPGFSSFVNYIKNTDCFANAKSDDFSKSASGDVTRTTTSPVQGSASCSVSGSASADKVKFLTKTFDSALYGQACEARFTYKGDGSKWKAYVEQGSNKVSPDTTLINTGSNSSIVSMNFACGDGSSSTSVVLEATASTPATIKVGATYVGLATNIQSGPITTDPVQYSPTWTGLGTVSNNSLYWQRDGGDLIVWGFVTAGTVTANAITFTLPSGLTIDTSKFKSSPARTNAFGYAHRVNGGGTDIALYADGQAGATMVVTYQGTNTPQLTFASKSGAFSDLNASAIISSGEGISISQLRIPVLGWTNSQFIRSTQSALQPAGEIMTFAGATCPTGWLAADGSAISRTDYGQMFARMGVAHGSGNGTTTFNLPDYRGRFLRGVAGGSANDPDRASRTAMAAGGNTGDNVGSVQADALGSHSHTSQAQANAAVNAGTFNVAMNTGGATLPTSTVGGNETRPKNAYVTYCVRAYDQISQAPILVGSVTNGSQLAMKHEAALISNGGGVTETGGSDWINGTCSAASGAQNRQYTCTINTGVFSATPTCIATVNNADASSKTIAGGATSATSFSFYLSQNGSPLSNDFNVMCFGPR